MVITIFISLDREIISPYSYYMKKGLVYIIITDPFSRQPSFYAKCTKLNTCVLYNMRSISLLYALLRLLKSFTSLF